jgi:hypothetical protein
VVVSTAQVLEQTVAAMAVVMVLAAAAVVMLHLAHPAMVEMALPV